MTTPEKRPAPRSFWVVYDDPSKPIGVYAGDKKPDDGVLAHREVIEVFALEIATAKLRCVISEYEMGTATAVNTIKELRAENEKLKDQAAVLSYRAPSEIMKENAQLKAQAERLCAALENIAAISGIDPSVCIYARGHAKDYRSAQKMGE